MIESSSDKISLTWIASGRRCTTHGESVASTETMEGGCRGSAEWAFYGADSSEWTSNSQVEAFPCQVSMSKWFSFEKFVEGAPREVQTSGARAGERQPILTIHPLQHPLSYPRHLLVARTFWKKGAHEDTWSMKGTYYSEAIHALELDTFTRDNWGNSATICY